MSPRQPTANVEGHVIRKVSGGYRVVSHTTGKNLGTYSTKAQAEKRLAQVKRFKK
jgi:hypothetical protein